MNGPIFACEKTHYYLEPVETLYPDNKINLPLIYKHFLEGEKIKAIPVLRTLTETFYIK